AGSDHQTAVRKPPLQRHGGHHHGHSGTAKDHTTDDRVTGESFRFQGDSVLEKIADGTHTLTNYTRSLQARKMQQALVDMGYDVGQHGVDGKFGDDTEAALRLYQHDAGISETGEFDQQTLESFEASFKDRKPYTEKATFDKTNPQEGLRKLGEGERKAVNDAMVPARGTDGKASEFKDEIGKHKYGEVIEENLQAVINNFHKTLYTEKKPLRKDPDQHFHSWDAIEGVAAASKKVTDNLYGSYKEGDALTHKKIDPVSGAAVEGNLIDQWEDEIARNSRLNDSQKQYKAREKVWYLVVSNLKEVHEFFSAVPTDKDEEAILTPIVESMVDTPEKVEKILQIETGWEGAQLRGTIYLQRYRQDTDEANRTQMYELFHICIHEYIHGLAHEDYQAYAQELDSARYNTLIEGFCDFFTENVRQSMHIDQGLQQQIEGDYYKEGNKVPAASDLELGVYDSIAQAEQIVSIIGTKNAQMAYFKGKTKYIGDQ
ncbi:MAG: peptidoglycan-binding domain-containing protein, partial [Bacteroidota bacterium]